MHDGQMVSAQAAGEDAVPPVAWTASTRSTVRRGLPDADAGEPGNPGAGEATCAYLKLAGRDGRLLPPGASTDPGHVCVALGEPLPQSLRQQELVCLRAGHVECPRYLRGLLILADPPRTSLAERARELPIAIVVAVLILVLSLGATIGFILIRGGLAVPSLGQSPSPASSAIAVLRTSPPPGSPGATRTAPQLTASPRPTPSPRPSPRPSTAPSATPGWPPGATASRMDLVTACPGTPDCYIYVVRPDDKLGAIADFFGTTLARVLQLNPWITDPSVLRVGDQITLPPPTR